MARMASKSMTAHELLLMPGGARHCELLRGEVVRVSAAGYQHGDIASQLGERIGTFVRSRGIGRYATAETGFWIEHDPDTVPAGETELDERATLRFEPVLPDLAVPLAELFE